MDDDAVIVSSAYLTNAARAPTALCLLGKWTLGYLDASQAYLAAQQALPGLNDEASIRSLSSTRRLNALLPADPQTCDGARAMMTGITVAVETELTPISLPEHLQSTNLRHA